MADEKAASKAESAAARTFLRLQADSAFRAALKRADNPDTEYQCWEYLAEFGVNVAYAGERRPYAVVLAAAAKSGRGADGRLGLGEALLAAYEQDKESSPARAKLRRIVSCTTTEELCSVLRSVLQFIGSRGTALAYGRLLDEVVWFERNPEQTKARWAQQFYGGASGGQGGAADAVAGGGGK